MRLFLALQQADDKLFSACPIKSLANPVLAKQPPARKKAYKNPFDKGQPKHLIGAQAGDFLNIIELFNMPVLQSGEHCLSSFFAPKPDPC